MKIQLLRNPAASVGCKIREGETGEVSDSLGGQLVQMGIAREIATEEAVEAKPQKVKGVAKTPEVSKPRAPEIKSEPSE